MRQIKFRALYDHMGGGWKYGMLIYEGKVPRIQVDGTMTFATCLKGTEGQFTGLKDCKGVDIYEGDILKSFPYMRLEDTVIISEVIFDERGIWMVNAVKYDDKEYLFESLMPAHETEVIGNVHQHPHLLTNSANQ